MKFSIALIFAFFSSVVIAQNIDVQHYKFEIQLSDNTDAITGKATITVLFTEDASQVKFDLASLENEKGMIAFTVMEKDDLLRTSQSNDVLTINLITPSKKGEIHTYVIDYMGTPKDGLIISKNKYGDRTFFADNWPNRAHNWIPCVDRPDDKATFEFIVTAPSEYRIISNGTLKEQKTSAGKSIVHWKEDVALPTKVMVIGAAKFAVKQFPDSPPKIPVSAWVYIQDSTKGFYDYAVAPAILKFFSNYIAPYPYEKLANVQSKTIFGGMENASAIFYSEESVTGDRKWEEVLAHEIAHQWFGDMASEKDFSHLWLSEGFATYLTDIYVENTYGKEAADKRLQKERKDVIEFAKTSDHSIVDSTSNLMSLLNANSYQKGGWVLHMLRNEVGDQMFQKILQSYYQQFKGGNAETRDFIKTATYTMQQDMRPFLHQWLYRPGIPLLKVTWKQEKNALVIKVVQTQKGDAYDLSLDVKIVEQDGTERIEKLGVHKKEETISLPSLKKPARILLDPNTKLLFDGNIKEEM